MKQSSEIFYAKILLFGEYSVIKGSMALTVPYTHFTGELTFLDNTKYTQLDFALSSNEQLRQYLQYLKKLSSSGELRCSFDIEDFENDLNNGLYYESNIPQGYGVGSSGALCAALYRNYVRDVSHRRSNLTSTEIADLKLIFSQLESYFHGTSSGIDPLNCYIKLPLLIRSKTDIQAVQIPRNKFNGTNGAIFLVDTKQTGKTGPLVNIFMERCAQPDYNNMMLNEYIPLNDKCISALTEGDEDEFTNALEQLSAYQLEYLSPMIPTDFHSLWKAGLRSRKYLLKLCGSGGGGFLLGFTRNWARTQQDFKDYNIETVLVYKQTEKQVVV